MKNNISRLIRKNILDLVPYSSAREEYVGDEGVFLDANENPYGTYNRYPDPFQRALKKELAALKNCAENTIYIGNGSDEIIDLAFRVFCEPYTDKALSFAPSYGMYRVSAQINGIEIIEVPLNTEFDIDINTTKPFLADEQLKLIFICSPNNPTGNLLSIKSIDWLLENTKGIVIVDEAYIDFSQQPSFIYKLEKYPNLIVCQTLSKAWGLAGIRLGIAYMHPEIAAVFNKIKAPYNVSQVNQEIALKTLQSKMQTQQSILEIISEKEKMTTMLQSLTIVEKIYPSDANFLLVAFTNATEVFRQLITQKIIVRNRNTVIKNCIRITIGTPTENQKLLTVLSTISHD